DPGGSRREAAGSSAWRRADLAKPATADHRTRRPSRPGHAPTYPTAQPARSPSRGTDNAGRHLMGAGAGGYVKITLQTLLSNFNDPKDHLHRISELSFTSAPVPDDTTHQPPP